MNTSELLTTTLRNFNLNETHFYQAWSGGTLPLAALKAYANEYGNFIGELARGWRTLGDENQACVEERHYELWKNDFCRALHVEIANITIPAIAELMDSAQAMFSEKTQALGALYVFTAQQASTSKSKIEGMKRYYHFPLSSESYFEEHLASDILAGKLISIIKGLSPEEQKQITEAASIFAKKLFLGLDSIYEKYQASYIDC